MNNEKGWQKSAKRYNKKIILENRSSRNKIVYHYRVNCDFISFVLNLLRKLRE